MKASVIRNSVRSAAHAADPRKRAVRSRANRVRGIRAAGDGSAPEESAVAQTLDLLGRRRLPKHKPTTRADVHSFILGGIPYAVLLQLVDDSKALSESDVADVVGISTRTLRRQKDTPTKPMPTELASRTWLFAEMLAKAAEVFGGREGAERWMSRPAMGLDGARPIDLLRTVQGAELVKEFLGRLEYGVYN